MYLYQNKGMHQNIKKFNVFLFLQTSPNLCIYKREMQKYIHENIKYTKYVQCLIFVKSPKCMCIYMSVCVCVYTYTYIYISVKNQKIIHQHV